jgi:hypothetical protein
VDPPLASQKAESTRFSANGRLLRVPTVYVLHSYCNSIVDCTVDHSSLALEPRVHVNVQLARSPLDC